MKRRDLIKKLEQNGWYFLRESSKHTVYTDGKKQETIERHTEIPNELAKSILRRNGIK